MTTITMKTRTRFIIFQLTYPWFSRATQSAWQSSKSELRILPGEKIWWWHHHCWHWHHQNQNPYLLVHSSFSSWSVFSSDISPRRSSLEALCWPTWWRTRRSSGSPRSLSLSFLEIKNQNSFSGRIWGERPGLPWQAWWQQRMICFQFYFWYQIEQFG